MKAKKEIEVLYYNILRLEEIHEDLPYNDPDIIIIEKEIELLKEKIKKIIKANANPTK